MRDHVKGAKSRSGLAVFERKFLPQLADKTPLAIPLGELARDKNQIARANVEIVVRTRFARLRQFDTKVAQVFVEVGWQGDSSLVLGSNALGRR